MDGRFNARDENGWMVPRAGSLSYKVYLRLKKGERPRQIADLLDMDANSVSQIIWRIRRDRRTR